MRTFKVTFFDRYDIQSVQTFHNVTNQSLFIERVANQIVCLGLAPLVRCESEGEDYTETVNRLIAYDINEIEDGYTRNYLTNEVGIL